MHRVGLPDGSYTLVPVEDDEGVAEELNYVAAEQDPDSSPADPQATLADEGKPRFH